MAQRRKSLRFAPFEEKYPCLVKFWKWNGHTNVPRKFEYEDEEIAPWAMGTWVSHLRSGGNGLKITAEHVKLLDALDFDWKTSTKARESSPKFPAKAKSRAASNSKKSPPKPPSSPTDEEINWSEWYKLPLEMRRETLSNHYPSERRENWNNTPFEKKLAIYARYIINNGGDTKVPPKYHDKDSNFWLGAFVERRRGMTDMDADQRKKLEAIGFDASGSIEREQGMAGKRKNQEPTCRLGKHPRAAKKAPPMSNSSSHAGGQRGSQKRASSRRVTHENNRRSQADQEDPNPRHYKHNEALADQFETRADLDAKIEEIVKLINEADVKNDIKLSERALEASKDFEAMKELRDSEEFRDVDDLETELAVLQKELEAVSQSTADPRQRVELKLPILKKIEPLKDRIGQEKARANFHAANKASSNIKQEAPESIEILDGSDDEDDERKPAAVGASGSQQTDAARSFHSTSSCDF